MKKETYAISILLTSFIFVIGIIIGSSISSLRIEDVQKRLQEDFLDTQSLELELIIAGGNESVCNYINYRLPEIVRKKAELGRKFDVENIEDEEKEVLYKQYVISLARYWIFNNIQEKQCGIKNPTVLFFFSQDETSREQGRVLDYLVFRSNKTLNIFAFNTAINEPLVRLIVDNHNITATPSVIINNTKYEGFQPAEKLFGILCENYNMTFC